MGCREGITSPQCSLAPIRSCSWIAAMGCREGKVGTRMRESIEGPHRWVGTSGLMGRSMRQYSRRYDVLEINYTFHRRGLQQQEFSALAEQLKSASVRAVVKVSIVATHENQLRDPESWWPCLWEGYCQLHKAGVLAALLWQCPPSLRYTEQSLRDLGHLCQILRDSSGTVRHVFDFRQSSWYSEAAVANLLRSHGFCLAWLHLCNDRSRWAGDLVSGWSTNGRTADFVYLRLFGSSGRSIGKYSEDFLHQEVLGRLPRDSDAFVVFGQGDVPMQALDNAWEVRQALGQVASSGNTQDVQTHGWRCHWWAAGWDSGHHRSETEGIQGFEHHSWSNTGPDDSGNERAARLPGAPAASTSVADCNGISGTVTWVEDGRIFVDIGNGQDAVLGARHVGGGRRLHANLSKGKRQGRMRFHIGERLAGLRIEAVDCRTGRVYLSSAGCQQAQCSLPGLERAQGSGGAASGARAPPSADGLEPSEASCSSSGGAPRGQGPAPAPRVLPAPSELGASPARRLTISTWGKARIVQPPDAQAHFACDSKKFHYLTRNNKHIKKLNGLDEVVQSRILRNGFFEDWIRETVQRIEREDLASLTLHCHKGTHLSVAVAEIMRKVYYPNAEVQHLTLAYVRPGRVGGPSRH
uniref:Uncharacterized protein n=1 Tax=Pyrodinium bahamense TaxID=73915 RepID=A0A7S0BA27_9DINO|mmetsp:Transcript_6793/g.18776  ORF Transcript_6793/g.18776 Transcript_6793/m.18776 type:complete len:638 (+) Transcript_6793:1-1914(+)